MQRHAYVCGDIGGTKSLLQAGWIDGGCPDPVLERNLPSAEFPDFSSLLRAFLRDPGLERLGARIRHACFAVAGPVAQGKVTLTNLPWELDAAALSRAFAVPRFELVNDFVAVAMGLPELGEADLLPIQPGQADARGARLALGAGTGLGVAGLVWSGSDMFPVQSEAGHMDFASLGAVQADLLAYLGARYGRVSCERVVSGPGLVNIFEFLQQRDGRAPSAGLARELAGGDGAAAIARHALARSDPLAQDALDLFLEIYGAVAGNLALAFLATGGVYLAGGVTPKIAPALTQGRFIRAFCSKGRFAPLLQRIPVRVVLNQRVGLLGAALQAARP